MSRNTSLSQFAKTFLKQSVGSFAKCVVDLNDPNVTTEAFFTTEVSTKVGDASDWAQLATTGNNEMRRRACNGGDGGGGGGVRVTAASVVVLDSIKR